PAAGEFQLRAGDTDAGGDVRSAHRRGCAVDENSWIDATIVGARPASSQCFSFVTTGYWSGRFSRRIGEKISAPSPGTTRTPQRPGRERQVNPSAARWS